MADSVTREDMVRLAVALMRGLDAVVEGAPCSTRPRPGVFGRPAPGFRPRASGCHGPAAALCSRGRAGASGPEGRGADVLAIIGGTGIRGLGAAFEAAGERTVDTAWSGDGVRVGLFRCNGASVAFLPRHGPGHDIPPHLINYRANIDALRLAGARRLVAVNSVGGIHPDLAPGALMVPEQIIDYTWGRESSFAREGLEHIDFTFPFDASLRRRLAECVEAVSAAGPDRRVLMDGGVYACAQGPRLETAAEIRRMRSDGCDAVGMTGMPEAALARELGLDYAMLALSVNRAAGLSPEALDMEAIRRTVREGAGFIMAALERLAGG